MAKLGRILFSTTDRIDKSRDDLGVPVQLRPAAPSRGEQALDTKIGLRFWEHFLRMLRPFEKAWIRYAFFILGPTLLIAAYLFGFAADMYMSQAKFGVRGFNSATSQQGLLGYLSGNTGLRSTFDEGASLQDFYRSRDAVEALREQLNLEEMYRPPEADIISRLRYSPSAEDLDDYYRRMVEIRFDQQSGVTTIRAYAYHAQDARAIVEVLLDAGEKLINRYSERARDDTLQFARSEVKAAEGRMEAVLLGLTEFRSRADLIDPNQQGSIVLKLATDLQSQLIQTKAQIAESEEYLRADAPRLRILRAQERALQEQFDREYAKLTGQSGALAPIMADYEKIQLQRDFASRELEGALSSLETARIAAERQQMYVVRVVDPVMPDESRYPRRWLILLGTLFISVVAYGISSLVVAGVRDHILQN